MLDGGADGGVYVGDAADLAGGNGQFCRDRVEGAEAWGDEEFGEEAQAVVAVLKGFEAGASAGLVDAADDVGGGDFGGVGVGVVDFDGGVGGDGAGGESGDCLLYTSDAADE